jgi:hypothetical protein
MLASDTNPLVRRLWQPPPDVFERPRAAQRRESLVVRLGVLAHQEAQMRQRRDERHRFVRRVEGEPAEMRQIAERRDSRRRDLQVVAPQVQREQSVEANELREAGVRDRSAQREIGWAGVDIGEGHAWLAAVPRDERRQFAKPGNAGIGHVVSGQQMVQLRPARERA